MKRFRLFLTVPLAVSFLVFGLISAPWTTGTMPARGFRPLLRQETAALETLVQVGQ